MQFHECAAAGQAMRLMEAMRLPSAQQSPFEVPDASLIRFSDYASDYALTEEKRVARKVPRDWVRLLLKHPETVTSPGDRRIVDFVIAPYLISYMKLTPADASARTFTFLKRCGHRPRPDKYRIDEQCSIAAKAQTRPFPLGKAGVEIRDSLDFKALNLLLDRQDEEQGPDKREEAFKQVSLALERAMGIKTFYELPLALGDWRAGDRSLRTPDFTVPELRCNGKVVIFDPHEFTEKPKRTIAYDVERWQKMHAATGNYIHLVLCSSSTRPELESKLKCKVGEVSDEYWRIMNKGSRLSSIKYNVVENMERLLERKDCSILSESEGHAVPQDFLNQVTGGMYLLKNPKRA
jgi:hypothetical protein